MTLNNKVHYVGMGLYVFEAGLLISSRSPEGPIIPLAAFGSAHKSGRMSNALPQVCVGMMPIRVTVCRSQHNYGLFMLTGPIMPHGTSDR